MAKKILLVDDTETVLLFLKIMLGHDYEYFTAMNGQEAVARAHEVQPDLVIMDVMMPIMLGTDALRTLREDPDTRDIPVIMLTTKTETALIEECFNLGCNDYLTKPIDKDELKTKVARALV